MSALLLLWGAVATVGLVLGVLVVIARWPRNNSNFRAMYAAAGELVRFSEHTADEDSAVNPVYFVGHGPALLAHTPNVARAETMVDGHPVAIELEKGAGEHPGVLRVQLPVSVLVAGGARRRPSMEPVTSTATAVLRRKTGAHRVAERLGLARRHRTGDAGLDSRIYVDTDASAETVARLLGDPAALAALARLFDAGLDRLEILHGGAVLTAVFRDPTVDRVAVLPEIARALVAFAAALPDLAPPAVGRLRAFRGAVLPVLIAGACVVSTFVAVIVEGPAGLLGRSVHIVDPTAPGALVSIGILAWIPLCGVLYLALQGRCHSVYSFVYSAMGLLLLSAALTIAGGTCLNALLDAGPAAAHVAVVKTVVTPDRADRKAYSVTLRSWHADWPDVEVKLLKTKVGVSKIGPRMQDPTSPGQREETLMKPGDRVTVLTRPGRFGWEWISELVPVTEEEGGHEAAP